MFFIKTELGLVDLKRLSADDDNDVNLNEIALQLKSLGDTTTEEELQEFNFIDDESSSKIYQAAILEEADNFLMIQMIKKYRKTVRQIFLKMRKPQLCQDMRYPQTVVLISCCQVLCS